MDSHTIAKLAREAGLVQGPWSNVEKQRVWQESRDFPGALETFAKLIAKECTKAIRDEIKEQQRNNIMTNTLGLNQAIYTIQEIFGE